MSRAIFVIDKNNVIRHVEYVKEVGDHPTTRPRSRQPGRPPAERPPLNSLPRTLSTGCASAAAIRVRPDPSPRIEKVAGSGVTVGGRSSETLKVCSVLRWFGA